MAETWWTESQAVQFVLHNRYPPCESLDCAHRLVRTMVLDGTVLTRKSRGIIELEAAALERLTPKRMPTRKGGRPPRPLNDTLRILAGRWIGHNGRPTVRARLEEYLAQVASDHGESSFSKDTAARLAQEALDVDQAHDWVKG